MDNLTVYEAPKILASFEAGEILAEAETSESVSFFHHHDK
jgi:hypothetical protein